ncbi:hypothetical protein [Lysobacter gummosus]
MRRRSLGIFCGRGFSPDTSSPRIRGLRCSQSSPSLVQAPIGP